MSEVRFETAPSPARKLVPHTFQRHALKGSAVGRWHMRFQRHLRLNLPILARCVHLAWTINSYPTFRRRLRKRRTAEPLRVVLGASGWHPDGWLPTEDYYLDIRESANWERYFRPSSIDALLAEHVFEHLSAADAVVAATHCYRFLRPGGYLRIAVPDGLHPSEEYQQHVAPGGTGPGAEGHRQVYDYRSLTTQLEPAGFSVRLIEFFDERGMFYSTHWQPEAGFIRRSSRFDPRNADGGLNYTSLIADAVKPNL